MRKLIAVVTCHSPAYQERAQAQRETWAQYAGACGFDLKFFLGNSPTGTPPRHDEVYLPVDDGYRGLPAKTQAVCQWALQQGYDYIFKTDDDVYLNMVQLARCNVAPYDYVGRFRDPSGGYPAYYASGFAYWLSRKAMTIIANSPLTDDCAEDRWVANTLAQNGVQGYTDSDSYVACYPPLLPSKVFSSVLRHAAAWCEYPPKMMHEMFLYHNATPLRNPAPPRLQPAPLHTSNVPQPPQAEPQVIRKASTTTLSDVCVLIKTFLRDGYLFDCVAAIERNLPEVRMVIIDDGKPTMAKDALYERLRHAGHTCEYLPFDSGFGAKANAAIKYFDRPYVLIGADDFDFYDTDVRYGIEKMFTVISNVPELGVASGRVDNNPYEGFLHYGEDFIRETPLKMGDWKTVKGVDYKLCDITVNYSVLRTEMFAAPTNLRWREFKIGGEHFWFFYDLGKAGWKTAFVPGVNISQCRYDPKKMDASYPQYRGRAWDCAGKFVQMWAAEYGKPAIERLHYIGFCGDSHDYVAVAKQRGLL